MAPRQSVVRTPSRRCHRPCGLLTMRPMLLLSDPPIRCHLARLSAATCARCYRTLLSAAAEAAACAAAAAWTTGVLQRAATTRGNSESDAPAAYRHDADGPLLVCISGSGPGQTAHPPLPCSRVRAQRPSPHRDCGHGGFKSTTKQSAVESRARAPGSHGSGHPGAQGRGTVDAPLNWAAAKSW